MFARIFRESSHKCGVFLVFRDFVGSWASILLHFLEFTVLRRLFPCSNMSFVYLKTCTPMNPVKHRLRRVLRSGFQWSIGDHLPLWTSNDQQSTSLALFELYLLPFKFLQCLFKSRRDPNPAVFAAYLFYFSKSWGVSENCRL